MTLGVAGARVAWHGGRRHQDLRRATAAAHEALDAILRSTTCFTSAEGYRRYLAAVVPIYLDVEAKIDASDAVCLLPDWPRRRRRDLIRAEMRAFGLGAGAPRPRREVAGTQAAPAPVWGAGDVFGALYVLEGATLGGALLARAMRERGTPRIGAACLLDPYGPERGAMWRAFLERLESVSLSHQEEELLRARAIATFSLFLAVGARLTKRGDAR